MNKFVFSILFLVAGVFILTSCGSKDGNTTDNGHVEDKMAVLSLIGEEVHDFGVVTEGDTVEHTFRFVNKGEYPLIINNVQTSCGCTAPEWPREPIAAGQESSILVRFDTHAKVGPQVKTIVVMANTKEGTSNLKIQGIVNAASTTAAK